MVRDEPRLLDSLEAALRRRQSRSNRRQLTVTPPSAIDFSSNCFLLLSRSAELRQSYIAELARTTSLPLGSGGSRLLDGNSQYAEDLEARIAAFHNAPEGLLFNSGYDANAGLFACLPRPDDVVIYDEHIHASVHEGMRLSRTKTHISFEHNSTFDLGNILWQLVEKDKLVQSGSRSVFIAVESVYSMDGDTAPLKAIVEMVETMLPLGNGHIIVDEAHSTGVYGKQGRGLVCELGLESKIFIRLHTFGKALTSTGAIVLCSRLVKDYLVNYARSLIYTTALGNSSLILTSTVYTFLQDGKTEEARTKLWQLTRRFYVLLKSQIPRTQHLQIPRAAPKSPIFALLTPQPRDLAQYCQQHNYVVRAIVPPTVSAGGERVRVCLHAGNDEKQVEGLVEVLRDWVLGQGNGSKVPAGSSRL